MARKRGPDATETEQLIEEALADRAEADRRPTREVMGNNAIFTELEAMAQEQAQQGRAAGPYRPEIGDIVLFRLPEGPGAGNTRPALIIEVYDQERGGHMIERLDLWVFVNAHTEHTQTCFWPNVKRGGGLCEWHPRSNRG